MWNICVLKYQLSSLSLPTDILDLKYVSVYLNTNYEVCHPNSTQSVYCIKKCQLWSLSLCVYRNVNSEVCLCVTTDIPALKSVCVWNTSSEVCLHLSTEVLNLKSVFICVLKLYQLWSLSAKIPALKSIFVYWNTNSDIVLTVIPTLILKSVSVCLLKYQLWRGSLSVYWNTNSEICLHCTDVLTRRAHNQDSKQSQQTILTLKSVFVCWNINYDTCLCLYILKYQLWNLSLCVS